MSTPDPRTSQPPRRQGLAVLILMGLSVALAVPAPAWGLGSSPGVAPQSGTDASSSLPLDPARKRFALEIVVFRELDPASGRREYWPRRLPARTPIDRALRLASARAYLYGIRPLPPSAYALDGVWSALAVSAPYQPVLHTGWIVPGYPISIAPYLRFSASDGVAGRVIGAVRLSLNRYLHAAVDAYWIGPPPEDSKERCPARGCVYPMVEAMKIPPAKLVYFDNPRFGIILEAWPLASRASPGSG